MDIITNNSKSFVQFNQFYGNYQSSHCKYIGLNSMSLDMVWPGFQQSEQSERIIIIKDCTLGELKTLSNQIQEQIQLYMRYPNQVVQIYEWTTLEQSSFNAYSEDDPDLELFLFIALEYLPHSFANLFEDPKTDSLQDLYPHILIEVFQIINTLQKNNIVHGNIKSQNIFLQMPPTPKQNSDKTILKKVYVKLSDFHFESKNNIDASVIAQLILTLISQQKTIQELSRTMRIHPYGTQLLFVMQAVRQKQPNHMDLIQQVISWQQIEFKQFTQIYGNLEPSQFKSMNGYSTIVFSPTTNCYIKKSQFNRIDFIQWQSFIEIEIKTQIEMAKQFPEQVLAINHWATNTGITDVQLYIAYESDKDSQSMQQYMAQQFVLQEESRVEMIEKLLLLACVLEWSQVEMRNVKSSNIIVSNGKFKLTDFGSARTHNLMYGLESSSKQVQQWQRESYQYLQPEFLEIQIQEEYTFREEQWCQLAQDSSMMKQFLMKNDQWGIGVLMIQQLTDIPKLDLEGFKQYFGTNEQLLEQYLKRIENENHIAVNYVLNTLMKVNINDRIAAEKVYQEFLKLKFLEDRRRSGLQIITEPTSQECEIIYGTLNKLKLHGIYLMDKRQEFQMILSQDQIQKQSRIIMMFEEQSQNPKTILNKVSQFSQKIEEFQPGMQYDKDDPIILKALQRFQPQKQTLLLQGEGQRLTQLSEEEKQKEARMKQYRGDKYNQQFQGDQDGDYLLKANEFVHQPHQLSKHQGNKTDLSFEQYRGGVKLKSFNDPEDNKIKMKQFDGQKQTQLLQTDGQQLVNIQGGATNQKTNLTNYDPSKTRQSLLQDLQGQGLQRIEDITDQSNNINKYNAEKNQHGFKNEVQGDKLRQITDQKNKPKQITRFNQDPDQYALMSEGQSFQYISEGNEESTPPLKTMKGEIQNQQMEDNKRNGIVLQKIQESQPSQDKLNHYQNNMEKPQLVGAKQGEPLEKIRQLQEGRQNLSQYQGDVHKTGISENQLGQPLNQIQDQNQTNKQINRLKDNPKIQQLQGLSQGDNLNSIVDFATDQQKLDAFNPNNQIQGFNQQGDNLYCIQDFDDDIEQNFSSFKGAQIILNPSDNKGDNLSLIKDIQNQQEKRLSRLNPEQLIQSQLNNDGTIQLKLIPPEIGGKNQIGKQKITSEYLLEPQFGDQLEKINQKEEQKQQQLSRLTGKFHQLDQGRLNEGQNLLLLTPEDDENQRLNSNQFQSKQDLTIINPQGDPLKIINDKQGDQNGSLGRLQAKPLIGLNNKDGMKLIQMEDLDHPIDTLNRRNGDQQVIGPQTRGKKLQPLKDNIVGGNSKPNQSNEEKAFLKNPNEEGTDLVIIVDPDKRQYGIKNKQDFPTIIKNNQSHGEKLKQFEEKHKPQNKIFPNPEKSEQVLQGYQVVDLNASISHPQSVSMVRHNQNDIDIHNSEYFFGFEVWSINKTIVKFQHWFIDTKQPFPDIPEEFKDLNDYTSLQPKYLDSQLERIKYKIYSKDDKPHGKGILMRYPTGAIYMGLWNYGKFVWGMVLELNPKDELTCYKGSYNTDYDRKHGFGKLEWYSFQKGNFELQESFQGEFCLGQIRGSGVRVYKNKDIYEGDWVNGVREGQGVLKYNQKQERYEGEFKNGKFNGNGTYYYENGQREVGQYKDGKSYGDHKVYNEQNELIKYYQIQNYILERQTMIKSDPLNKG